MIRKRKIKGNQQMAMLFKINHQIYFGDGFISQT